MNAAYVLAARVSALSSRNTIISFSSESTVTHAGRSSCRSDRIINIEAAAIRLHHAARAHGSLTVLPYDLRSATASSKSMIFK